MDSLRSRQTVLAVGAAASAAAVGWIIYTRAGFWRGRHDPAELAALAELSRRFFYVCRDVAQIAKTVRARIAEEKKTGITEEGLKRQLKIQCQVLEKLQQIEAEVAEQFNCTRESIQDMQKRCTQNDIVRAHTEGFKTMLEDALEGRFPMLPNVQIPEELTKHRIMEIELEAQALECKKTEGVEFGGMSSEDVGKKLRKIAVEAWDETLCNRSSEFGPGGKEAYHSAKALYLRDPQFNLELEAVAAAQAKKRHKIMKQVKT